MTLGKCINSYRIKNDMTMDAFAQKAHLTKAYISMLENGNKNRGGKRPAPSIETYKKCAFAMDISFDDLLKMVDDRISINPTESKFYSQLNDMSADLWVKQQVAITDEFMQADTSGMTPEEQSVFLQQLIDKYAPYRIAPTDSSSESIASALDQLSDNQLDDLFMQLISGKDKDYLLRLASKILEIASHK